MALKWFTSAESMKSLGTVSPVLNVYPIYRGPFPLVHDALADGRNDLELVSAQISRVAIDDDNYVVVILCRIQEDGKAAWSFYCGDKQVSGQFLHDGKNLAAKLKAAGGISKNAIAQLEASAWTEKVPDMGQCAFFRMVARGSNGCSHTGMVLATTPLAEIESLETELRAWLSGEDSVTKVVEELSPEEEAFYDAAFVQNVLLAGERGAGKTYLARAAAAKYDAVYLEMQMHPSMEAWEFRAHDRAWNGKVYTVLGKLAEAVYWIQQGKKVVLCMDEFLNMNPIYQTVINTALTLTSNETYIIETGRIIDQGDGIGIIETVEVPSNMLWVVATSNIGARYGLDKLAPSVRARFQIVLMNTNADRTKKILEKNLSMYDMPVELADLFKKFIEACNQAVNENTLDEEATTRLACNVIRACRKKADRDKLKLTTLTEWMPHMKKQLMREIAQVVNFELGPLDPDQEARYTSLVDVCFRARK